MKHSIIKHGGNITQAAAVYGYQPDEMLDLSTGISPRSYPIDLSLIPPRQLRDLPQAEDEAHVENLMRRLWDVPDGAAIVLAPGSGLLINLMPYLRGGANGAAVFMPSPTYSEHETAWNMAGYRLQYYDAGVMPPATAKTVVAVQPGNPLGNCAPPQDWQPILDELVNSGGLVVMDEAFIDLMPEFSLMPKAGQKGLVILRSLGKFYGLAGVRLGAAIGHPDDIFSLKQMIGPWGVSALSLNIGAQALADTAWPDQQRQWLKAQMARLHGVLNDAGLDIIGGTDLYCLVDINPKNNAETLHKQLAQAGIWTRIFGQQASQGASKGRAKGISWIRFGLPENDDEFAQLTKALLEN